MNQNPGRDGQPLVTKAEKSCADDRMQKSRRGLFSLLSLLKKIREI